MAKKANHRHPQVTVNGKLVDNTSQAEPDRQLYRYHVNILKPDQSRRQEYDREIHIHNPAQNQSRDNKPVNTPSISRDDDNFPQAQPAHAVDVDNVVALDRKDQPDTSLISKQVIAKLIRKKWRIKSPSFKTPGFNFAPIKQSAANIKNKISTMPKRMVGWLKNMLSRFAIPELKLSPARNIFANTNQRHIAKPALAGALVMALALLIYFLPYKTETIAPLVHQSASISSEKTVNAKQGYHAVIKQNTDGITISIQGPEHEEVLTKLPPGYHPVLDGNKIVHVVTPGNTLWFIAKRYIKNPYRYPELVRLNKIKNPDLIYPGERVIIQYIRKP